MITSTEFGDQVAGLVARFGHVEMAAASTVALAAYARAGARAAASRENELLRDGAPPAGEVRVSPELTAELQRLRRAAGHQTFFLAMAIMAGQYAFRGGRGMEADALDDPERCPSCRERLASAERLKATIARARNNRPLGGTATAVVNIDNDNNTTDDEVGA